jgi:hypothetical protein
MREAHAASRPRSRCAFRRTARVRAARGRSSSTCCTRYLLVVLRLERLGDALGSFLLLLMHLFGQLLELRDVALAAFSLSFF